VVGMRQIVVAASFLIGIGSAGYLLVNEFITPPEVTGTHVALKVDPLLQIQYTESNRKVNMQAFGLSERMQQEALDRMKRISQQHNRKIELLLDGAADPNAVSDALCGYTAQVRPRYGALRFLVKEKNGLRSALRVSSVTDLDVQEWAVLSPISDVYNQVELSDDREDDATLMALAAILESREEDVIKGFAPWGRGLLPGQWSWEKVMGQYSGVDERVIEYLAVMHLFVEAANADGGICGEEDDQNG
jgi:hypothetical protein